MDNSIKNVAKLGYAAKGTVYALVGTLTFGGAIGLGRRSEGKLGVLKFLQHQPFGNVLLGIVALGLLCYSFWRFFQSLSDPENIGSEAKGIAKRAGFFLSGVVYLGLGVFAIVQIFSQGGNNTTGNSSLIPTEYLDYAFYTIAAALAIKAIFQLVKVYKGAFLEKFQLDSLSNINTRRTIKYLGYAGMISRAIVIGIVSYVFFIAADTANKGDMRGTSDAFSFLRQNSEGPWLVGAVALGLICYGAYMFIMAKYRSFDDF